MDPEYIKGPNGEKLRLHYENKPETWTEKELMVAIMKELQEIRKVLEKKLSRPL